MPGTRSPPRAHHSRSTTTVRHLSSGAASEGAGPVHSTPLRRQSTRLAHQADGSPSKLNVSSILGSTFDSTKQHGAELFNRVVAKQGAKVKAKPAARKDTTTEALALSDDDLMDNSYVLTQSQHKRVMGEHANKLPPTGVGRRARESTGTLDDSSEPLTKSHYKRVMATHAKKLPLGRPARESTGTLDDSSEPLTKSHYKRVMGQHAKKLPPTGVGARARESTGTFDDSSEPLTESQHKRVMATHAKKLPLGRPARESTGTLDVSSETLTKSQHEQVMANHAEKVSPTRLRPRRQPTGGLEGEIEKETRLTPDSPVQSSSQKSVGKTINLLHDGFDKDDLNAAEKISLRSRFTSRGQALRTSRPSHQVNTTGSSSESEETSSFVKPAKKKDGRVGGSATASEAYSRVLSQASRTNATVTSGASQSQSQRDVAQPSTSASVRAVADLSQPQAVEPHTVKESQPQSQGYKIFRNPAQPRASHETPVPPVSEMEPSESASNSSKPKPKRNVSQRRIESDDSEVPPPPPPRHEEASKRMDTDMAMNADVDAGVDMENMEFENEEAAVFDDDDSDAKSTESGSTGSEPGREVIKETSEVRLSEGGRTSHQRETSVARRGQARRDTEHSRLRSERSLRASTVAVADPDEPESGPGFDSEPEEIKQTSERSSVVAKPGKRASHQRETSVARRGQPRRDTEHSHSRLRSLRVSAATDPRASHETPVPPVSEMEPSESASNSSKPKPKRNISQRRVESDDSEEVPPPRHEEASKRVDADMEIMNADVDAGLDVENMEDEVAVEAAASDDDIFGALTTRPTEDGSSGSDSISEETKQTSGRTSSVGGRPGKRVSYQGKTSVAGRGQGRRETEDSRLRSGLSVRASAGADPDEPSRGSNFDYDMIKKTTRGRESNRSQLDKRASHQRKASVAGRGQRRRESEPSSLRSPPSAKAHAVNQELAHSLPRIKRSQSGRAARMSAAESFDLLRGRVETAGPSWRVAHPEAVTLAKKKDIPKKMKAEHPEWAIVQKRGAPVATADNAKSKKQRKQVDFFSNANMISKEKMAGFFMAAGEDMSKVELDKTHAVTNVMIQKFLDKLCASTPNPNGIFAFRELEEALQAQEWMSCKSNILSLEFAAAFTPEQLHKMSGILIPRPGQDDTNFDEFIYTD